MGQSGSDLAYLVDRKFAENYAHALQVGEGDPDRSWPEFSAEDSVRFWGVAAARDGLRQDQSQQDHRRQYRSTLSE